MTYLQYMETTKGLSVNYMIRARSRYLFLEKTLIRCFYGEFNMYKVEICKNQPFIWKPLKSPLGVLIWTELEDLKEF
jgi:hypothetical protein